MIVQQEPRGLGVIPVAALTSAWNLTQSFLRSHPKDSSRFNANQQAFTLAVQNRDQNALEFLRLRSGKFGQENVPGYGDVAGWATGEAQDHAWKLYNQALIALGYASNAPGFDPGNSGSGSGGGYIPGGGQPLPNVPITASQNFVPLLAAGAVIYLLMNKRK